MNKLDLTNKENVIGVLKNKGLNDFIPTDTGGDWLWVLDYIITYLYNRELLRGYNISTTWDGLLERYSVMAINILYGNLYDRPFDDICRSFRLRGDRYLVDVYFDEGLVGLDECLSGRVRCVEVLEEISFLWSVSGLRVVYLGSDFGYSDYRVDMVDGYGFVSSFMVSGVRSVGDKGYVRSVVFSGLVRYCDGRFGGGLVGEVSDLLGEMVSDLISFMGCYGDRVVVGFGGDVVYDVNAYRCAREVVVSDIEVVG